MQFHEDVLQHLQLALLVQVCDQFLNVLLVSMLHSTTTPFWYALGLFSRSLSSSVEIYFKMESNVLPHRTKRTLPAVR